MSDLSNRIVQGLWSHATSSATTGCRLRDESLEDSAYLAGPHVLAGEIAEDLRDARGQIERVLADLEARVR